jgi:hypothetical protein
MCLAVIFDKRDGSVRSATKCDGCGTLGTMKPGDASKNDVGVYRKYHRPKGWKEVNGTNRTPTGRTSYRGGHPINDLCPKCFADDEIREAVKNGTHRKKFVADRRVGKRILTSRP